MARYHIKDDGNPGLCRAAEGACPKGGAHFDNEAEARAAVEQLFGNSFGAPAKKAEPEPLAVYTKTAVKQQWSDLISPKTGYMTYEAQRDPLLSGQAWDHVSEVMHLLTDNRLDVKSQNAKVREQLATKVEEMQAARTGKDPQARLDAAVGLHHTMRVLTRHYDFEDPRTEGQQEADEAYATGYEYESSAAPNARHFGGGQYGLQDLSDEDLAVVEAIGSQAPENLTLEDLTYLASKNEQAAQNEYFGNLDRKQPPLDQYREDEALRRDIEGVPETHHKYLASWNQPAAIAKRQAQAVHRITHIVPETSYGSPQGNATKSLAEVARDTRAIRAENAKLEQAVLDS